MALIDPSKKYEDKLNANISEQESRPLPPFLLLVQVLYQHYEFRTLITSSNCILPKFICSLYDSKCDYIWR
jgi:hypothetical protein